MARYVRLDASGLPGEDSKTPQTPKEPGAHGVHAEPGGEGNKGGNIEVTLGTDGDDVTLQWNITQLEGTAANSVPGTGSETINAADFQMLELKASGGRGGASRAAAR